MTYTEILSDCPRISTRLSPLLLARWSGISSGYNCNAISWPDSDTIEAKFSFLNMGSTAWHIGLTKGVEDWWIQYGHTFFCLSMGPEGNQAQVHRPFIGLLHQSWMIYTDDCEAISDMMEPQGNRTALGKSGPAPLCPPQVLMTRAGLEPGPSRCEADN
jgi:hypothetical protein